jgi:diguanylate cyclase (GGDEF)-like protein
LKSLRTKLLLSFGILLVALSTTISVSYLTINSLNKSIKEMYEDQYIASVGVAKLGSDLNSVRAALITMMSEKERSRQEAQHEVIKDLTKEIDSSFGSLLNNPSLMENVKDALKKARETWTAFRDTRDRELIPAIYGGQIEKARALAMGIQKERYEKFKSIMQDLLENKKKEIQNNIKTSKEHTKRLITTLTVIGFLSVFLLLSISVFLSRSITTPIRSITKAAKRIASGDLNVEVKVMSKDETGILANAFNNMASNLKHSLEEQKRLYSAEQRKVQQMAVLQDAVAAIASHLDVEPLLEHLTSLSALLVKAELSGLVILHPETDAVQYFKANISPDDFPVKTMPKGKGLLGAVLRGSAPIRLADASADPRFEGLPSGHPFIRGFIGVPMLLKDKVIGGIFVANKEDDAPFTQEDEDLIFMLSLQAATAVENARLYTKTAELATTDGLTGLLNRRAFMERLAEEAGRSSRYERYFSLLLIDIDHFKLVNDTYGHPAGDAVLKSLSQTLKMQIRSVDIAGRYGGEEFVIILPETNSSGAQLVGERIRNVVSKLPFMLPNGSEIGLTISIGIASFPEDASEKEELLRKADEALYFAKEHGRNMACNYLNTLSGILEKRPEELDNILNDPSLKGIKELAMAVDLRSSYMRGHSMEVAAYATGIAKTLNLDNPVIEGIRVAGLLHDVGNVAIPIGILNKTGQLSEEEKIIIKGHPGLAEMLLKKYPHIEVVLPTILYHHERYDGKGYPLGLTGKEIPLYARILAVAEAFQAMVSSRPYRERLTLDQSIEELRRNAGTQFDPEIVEAFVKTIKDKDGTNP